MGCTVRCFESAPTYAELKARSAESHAFTSAKFVAIGKRVGPLSAIQGDRLHKQAEYPLRWTKMFEGMPILLLIWLAVGISLAWLVSQKRQSSAGLPLAYFLGLSLIHVPGALLYLDAEESNYTRIGFEQTIIGMVAFLGGVTIARCVFVTAPGQQASAGRPQGSTSQSFAALDRLALLYLGVGAVAYFVMLRVAARIPSATAFVAPLGSLIMVGACLRLWVARESRNRLKFWSTMALLPVLPLATVIQGGFIGFGTYWVLAIVTFMFAQSKRRVGYFLLAPVVCLRRTFGIRELHDRSERNPPARLVPAG